MWSITFLNRVASTFDIIFISIDQRYGSPVWQIFSGAFLYNNIIIDMYCQQVSCSFKQFTKTMDKSYLYLTVHIIFYKIPQLLHQNWDFIIAHGF